MDIETEHSVVLCLGSNCGDKLRNVSDTISELSEILTAPRACAPYSSEPLSGKGERYVNAVMCGRWCGEMDTLESLCKEIERAHGRDEECRARHEVPIDIDVVIADGKAVRPDAAYAFFQIGYRRLFPEV